MSSSSASSPPRRLPLPGAPSSSWAALTARMSAVVRHRDTRVVVAFWLLGLINNVLYVVILSAAQDLVGTLPKGVVLLADVVPSFVTKLVAPYFIQRVPYSTRVLVCVAVSSAGMLLVALTPASQSAVVKLAGVALASFSSGGGELSFLGLTHYYGAASLAGWGSGTGAAGLVGAGLYVVLTEWWGLAVRQSLLVSACLPAVMLLSFFAILPREPLREATARWKDYDAVPDDEEEDLRAGAVEDMPRGQASAALLTPGPSGGVTAFSAHSTHPSREAHSLRADLRRARSLVVPYMLPLLLVYVAEYTINQGVAPTLLFPVESSPFRELRSFYPFYSFLYQLGVFVSRSSTPWVRINHLYVPAGLQVANLVLLTAQALLYFFPSVWLVFAVVLWEGLLGGAVYVNTFAEIMETVPAEDREFSLSVTTVSDSGGICIAGVLGIGLETGLCEYQVAHGRDWCRRIQAQ